MVAPGHSGTRPPEAEGPGSAPKSIRSGQGRRKPTAYFLNVALVLVAMSCALEAKCEDVNVTKPVALYVGLSAADLASTEWALHSNPRAYEANPLMRTHRVPKQLAVAALFTAADLHFQKQGRKGSVRTIRVIYAVLRVGAAAINVHQARKGNR